MLTEGSVLKVLITELFYHPYVLGRDGSTLDDGNVFKVFEFVQEFLKGFQSRMIISYF